MSAFNQSALDRVYLDRAYELAQRGRGSTSPNPPVGAVLVRDDKIIGEGYHHKAGQAHAEVEALRAAGEARGATAYVSLEPCNHTGRTPPCSHALVEAGIARVVIGTIDPNPITDNGGIKYLRDRGVAVEVANDVRARTLVDIFAHEVTSDRPYVALKLAMSLDGYVTSKPGVQEWLTSEETRLYVRDLRIEHDAVMVGAGTVRVDDPQLTVRPPYHRLRPYVRIVACENDSVPANCHIFEPNEDYVKTIVLAPAGLRERFEALQSVAEVIFVGSDDARELDLDLAMRTLREHGIMSILCEGGPTLGGRLLAAGLVDRVYWAIAPRFLAGPHAVPVLRGADLAAGERRLHIERVERVGEDAVVVGVIP